MKSLLLIGILSICNMTFSMDWKQKVQSFQTYYKKAQELESTNESEALKWYAKAAATRLPKIVDIPLKKQNYYLNLNLVKPWIYAINKITDLISGLKEEENEQEVLDTYLLCFSAVAQTKPFLISYRPVRKTINPSTDPRFNLPPIYIPRSYWLNKDY